MSNQNNAATLKQLWEEDDAHLETIDFKRKMVNLRKVGVLNGFVNSNYDGHHVFMDQYGIVIGITSGYAQHKTIPILNNDKYPIYVRSDVCWKVNDLSADNFV